MSGDATPQAGDLQSKPVRVRLPATAPVDLVIDATSRRDRRSGLCREPLHCVAGSARAAACHSREITAAIAAPTGRSVNFAHMTEFIPPGTQFFALPSPFPMKRGGALHDARVAYETWGTLNAARDNAVLIVTGLSPDAHAAANAGNPEPGWWEAMLGPGKPIDTDRWFVVCVNSLGSCKGSTGPASINPATGALYRLDFPELSVEDGANAAFEVVRGLGIERLACLIGNSMGGMTALAYLLLHPGSARAHINISGSARALPFSIAIRSLQREAIRLDPAWNDGQYDDATYPESGMRMARKLGVITYRSALEWDGRFGRVRLESDRPRRRGAVRPRVRGGELPRRPRAPLRAPLRSQLLPLPQPLDGLVRHG